MQVRMLTRPQTKVCEIPIGSTFKMVGRNVCFQMIDLTKVDGFISPPTLRDDVIYCTNLETGVVEILPKSVEVELVSLNVNEEAING